MTSPSENTKDILVIYEEEAEEWALYLKSLFKHIIKEQGILLYNLETLSIQHLESLSLSCYRCKLLILSNGLLKCLNQKRRYFLDRVLKPSGRVVILLCGVENSDILHEILTLDQSSQEISTDQDPEEYLSIVAGIIQQDEPQNEEAKESLSCIYETVLADVKFQAKKIHCNKTAVQPCIDLCRIHDPVKKWLFNEEVAKIAGRNETASDGMGSPEDKYEQCVSQELWKEY
ncbi:unnamed protein product [Caretta caretta]